MLALDYAAWILTIGGVIDGKTEAAFVQAGLGRYLHGIVCLTDDGDRAARQYGRLHYSEHCR